MREGDRPRRCNARLTIVPRRPFRCIRRPPLKATISTAEALGGGDILSRIEWFLGCNIRQAEEMTFSYNAQNVCLARACFVGSLG